jgi:hypothetical protein
MRCDDVRSVYELPKDFGVSYDNVRELSDNGEVRESDDGEVRESDDGEVRESDDDLEVPHARGYQTRCNMSYVPACVSHTP